MSTILPLPIVIMGMLFFGCGGNARKPAEDSAPSSQTEGVADHADEQREYCYKNEIPVSWNEQMIEVEELRFTVEGDSIKGTFKWIPIEKGGLSGEISGIKKNDLIDAVYQETYAEEPFPIALKILLAADEAHVTSSDESWGSYTLKKIECDQYQ